MDQKNLSDLKVASSSKKDPSVLRSAGLMSVATFLSRILGLVREQVIGIFFGASHATDAYLVAFRIPNLMRDLFAEGAMSASLVPTFTEERIKHGDRRAWYIAGLVFKVLFFGVGLLTLVGILVTPWLVELYAGAYRSVEGKFELTVFLTRVIFPFFPVVCLAAAFMGILNSCGVFFIPSLASAVFNLVSICVALLGLMVFKETPILAVAVGVVIGGVAQAAVQWPSLKKVGFKYQKRESSDPVWYRDPALKRMLWLMIPGTIGLAATQINILVNTILATGVSAREGGAVTHLSFAFRLMQFPIGIFGVSLASATLPKVSRLWVEEKFSETVETLHRSLRLVFAINLSAAAGLVFLAEPIIALLFQYRQFSAEDTHRTAQALLAYALGLAAYSGVKVLVPTCYALGNTRLPVISSVLAVVVTIGANLALVGPFGVAGLAFGTSIAAVGNFLFLLWAVDRLFREKAQTSFESRRLFKPFLAWSGLAFLMGLVVWGCHRALVQFILPDSLLVDTFGGSIAFLRALRVSICLGVAGVTILGLGRILGFEEVQQIFNIFRQKLKKV